MFSTVSSASAPYSSSRSSSTSKSMRLCFLIQSNVNHFINSCFVCSFLFAHFAPVGLLTGTKKGHASQRSLPHSKIQIHGIKLFAYKSITNNHFIHLITIVSFYKKKEINLNQVLYILLILNFHLIGKI